MAVGIRQIADLVDDQQYRAGIQGETAAKGVVTVLGGQFIEHGGGIGEQHRVTGQHRLMGQHPERVFEPSNKESQQNLWKFCTNSADANRSP